MTTTDYPTITLPAVASKLKNGCWCLAAKQGRFHDQAVVLGFHSGAGAVHPFATWHVNAAGLTYSGNYHRTLGEAMADYAERS